LSNSKAVKFIRGIKTSTAALIIQFLVSVAFQLMGSFIPLFFENEFTMTLIEATSWTGTMALISSTIMAVTAPFWGWMCDRVGVKKILLFVIIGNVIAYSGMALSSNVLQIIFFRSLQGCFGGISTVMFTLVALDAKPSELKNALSYQMAAQTVGGLVSPGIGGALASIIGYRLTFATSAVLFLLILPLIMVINLPPPVKIQKSDSLFLLNDYLSLMPTFTALIMVYSCISFIMPSISWFLQSLGIPNNQLLFWTTAATVLNGLTFAIATPLLTRVTTEKTLPLLSVGASILIIATAFVVNPIQFIILRLFIGGIQAGIPPNLIGGKRGRRGAGIGFLNSARFLGMAFGPFIATSILGDGTPPKPLFMFGTMSIISLVTALFIYFTYSKKEKDYE
jgi:DHA1 family multidrug resistance protein-like MFS transporter